MARDHLHADDHPQALAVLKTLFAGRADAASAIGYEPSGHGVWVDWDRLERSWLSSTERAAVVVPRGVAAAERHGGWPPRLGRVLADAVGAL